MCSLCACAEDNNNKNNYTADVDEYHGDLAAGFADGNMNEGVKGGLVGGFWAEPEEQNEFTEITESGFIKTSDIALYDRKIAEIDRQIEDARKAEELAKLALGGGQ